MLLVLNAKDMLLTLYTVTILNILTMHTKIWSFQPFLAFTFYFIFFFDKFHGMATIKPDKMHAHTIRMYTQSWRKISCTNARHMLFQVISAQLRENSIQLVASLQCKERDTEEEKKNTIRGVIREGMLKL